MKQFFLSFLITGLAIAGLSAQTPQDAVLPKPLQKLEAILLVSHFPSPVFATTDDSRQDFQYFWKHNTAVLSPEEDVQVEECGAYLFYNNQWNLRVRYSKKDFTTFFNCPGGKMKKGQPYTFIDNWRTDNRLMGGWAMWYFIGRTASGKRVGGYEKLETVGAVYSMEDKR